MSEYKLVDNKGAEEGPIFKIGDRDIYRERGESAWFFPREARPKPRLPPTGC